MSTIVSDLPAELDSLRKHWTRAEYEELCSLESLQQQRLELVEGELISKMGKKRPHTNALVRLQRWLVSVFGWLRVNPETSIDVSPEDNPTSEPEPDLIVLRSDSAELKRGNPGPADLVLVVEISDSTLGLDLTTKAGLYARAGIIEYWVLDVAGQRLIVHRDPKAGRYASVLAYGVEDSVAPLAAPNSIFLVKEAFPL